MDEVVRLIEAEIPRLRRYARVLLRRRPDAADDLVQDTILRGIEKMHLFASGTNLRAWLFTVMHNQYVNSIRRATRHGHEIEVEKVHLSAPPTQTASLELRDLERAIDRLPDEQRITLLLIGLEGMKYEEVAQICSVPIGTVRSRLSRAREELRRMLDGADDVPRMPPSLRPADAETDPGVEEGERGAAWHLSAVELRTTAAPVAAAAEPRSSRRPAASLVRLPVAGTLSPPRRRNGHAAHIEE
jgi:RNA polymerase sigma-70 factor (ECF subfamily)